MSPKLVKQPIYLTCCNHALPVTITLLYLLVSLFVLYFICVLTRLSSDIGNVAKTSEATQPQGPELISEHDDRPKISSRRTF